VTIGKSDEARAAILARIRKAQGRSARPSTAEAEAIDTYLRRHPRGPLPEIREELVARFRARAEAMVCTVEEVASLADAPAAAARYLQSVKVSPQGCVWPSLAALDWAGAGMQLEARVANGDDAVGVTGVFAAIAETGTLVVVSDPETPSSVSLVPETHIAIVPVSRIVAHMEDDWDLARRELGQLPRAVNFISGPSRTADIDQTIVVGAHGPSRVHLILVRSAG